MSDGENDYARNMSLFGRPQPKTATRSMEEMEAEINERLKELRAVAETTREAFAVGDVPKLLEEIEFLGLIHNRLHSVVVDYMRARRLEP